MSHALSFFCFYLFVFGTIVICFCQIILMFSKILRFHLEDFRNITWCVDGFVESAVVLVKTLVHFEHDKVFFLVNLCTGLYFIYI